MASAAALVVSAFLIYNAMALAIAQRRPTLSLLRAVGGWCGPMVRDLLAEAVLVGVVGGAVGAGVGILMGVLASVLASAFAARAVYRVRPIEALVPVGAAGTDTVRPALRRAAVVLGLAAVAGAIHLAETDLGLWSLASMAAIASEQMCTGMVIEAADQYVASRSEQAYLDAIDGKTAALLSFACRVGAMQADCSDEQVEALAAFGRNFGLAYQLWDDILDVTSSAEEMGKPVNTDLFEGIFTLPVIRAAARDRSLARLLSRRMTREDAAHARELVLASGAVQEAQAVADDFMDQAQDQLAALPVDLSARHTMTAYARFVLDRRTPHSAVSGPSTPPPEPDGEVVSPQAMSWLRSWMADTGLIASAAEADHQWARVFLVRFPAQSLTPADAAREQTTVGMSALLVIFDDLFDDPQLRDPEAVTALRHGLTWSGSSVMNRVHPW
jgi:hypothetical protein